MFYFYFGPIDSRSLIHHFGPLQHEKYSLVDSLSVIVVQIRPWSSSPSCGSFGHKGKLHRQVLNSISVLSLKAHRATVNKQVFHCVWLCVSLVVLHSFIKFIFRGYGVAINIPEKRKSRPLFSETTHTHTHANLIVVMWAYHFLSSNRHFKPNLQLK